METLKQSAKKTLNDTSSIGCKNTWLVKLKNDLRDNKHNLKKAGLYNGFLKEGIENLLSALKDYDIK
jgi:hypothetical protein